MVVALGSHGRMGVLQGQDNGFRDGTRCVTLRERCVVGGSVSERRIYSASLSYPTPPHWPGFMSRLGYGTNLIVLASSDALSPTFKLHWNSCIAYI